MSGCAFALDYDKFVELFDKQTEKMIGEVLTTVEAAVVGDRQADATKALIKQAMWRFNRDVKLSLAENKKVGSEGK